MLEVTAPADPGIGAPIGDALADELGLASRMLGDLAFELGSDEGILRRHMTALQTIDHITQMLLIVADLLIAGKVDRHCLDTVTLEDMRERLRMRIKDAA